MKQANKLHPPCFKQNVSASIQIEETLIGKRRNYNKRKYLKQELLFGMSQQVEHLCYITRVEKRDKKTLIPIITGHADPSSKFKRLAFEGLQGLGYDHSVVIHKEEFVSKQGDHRTLLRVFGHNWSCGFLVCMEWRLVMLTTTLKNLCTAIIWPNPQWETAILNLHILLKMWRKCIKYRWCNFVFSHIIIIKLFSSRNGQIY